MDVEPRVRMTADAFIAWSRAQPEGCRFELANGEIVQMGSGRARHAIVKGEVFALLRQAVRERGLVAQVFPSGMSVQIDENTIYEPDAAVRCGAKLDDEVAKYSDPVIVVEVLSPSTRGLDAAGKLADYFRLPSIEHYLILDPAKNRLIHHRRDDNGIRTQLLADGTLRLDPPGLTLNVDLLFG